MAEEGAGARTGSEIDVWNTGGVYLARGACVIVVDGTAGEVIHGLRAAETSLDRPFWFKWHEDLKRPLLTAASPFLHAALPSSTTV
jgi:hypothetical protein